MVELLKKLSDLKGVGGEETEVRQFILEQIKPYVNEIRVDNMGNVIALKKGSKSERKLLIAAHMDEVGFIVSSFTDDGFLKFKSVGTIDSRNIVSKCVKIGNGIDGIIGMKAIHLQKKEERESTVEIKDLYIDIGAKSKKEAMKKVKLGDRVVFGTKCTQIGKNICGKALDGRIGCLCLIEALKWEYEDDIYFVFTTQREVGMRGASVAAYGLDIDIALVVEGFESSDMYGCEDADVTAVLGNGVCVDFMDRFSIPDRELTKKLKSALKDAHIKVQDKHSMSGLTDAGAIQRSCDGIKTACIGVPVRYTHTQSCMASEEDIEMMKCAVKLFAKKAGELI